VFKEKIIENIANIAYIENIENIANIENNIVKNYYIIYVPNVLKSFNTGLGKYEEPCPKE